MSPDYSWFWILARPDRLKHEHVQMGNSYSKDTWIKEFKDYKNQNIKLIGNDELLFCITYDEKHKARVFTDPFEDKYLEVDHMPNGYLSYDGKMVISETSTQHFSAYRLSDGELIKNFSVCNFSPCNDTFLSCVDKIYMFRHTDRSAPLYEQKVRLVQVKKDSMIDLWGYHAMSRRFRIIKSKVDEYNGAIWFSVNAPGMFMPNTIICKLNLFNQKVSEFLLPGIYGQIIAIDNGIPVIRGTIKE